MHKRRALFAVMIRLVIIIAGRRIVPDSRATNENEFFHWRRCCSHLAFAQRLRFSGDCGCENDVSNLITSGFGRRNLRR